MYLIKKVVIKGFWKTHTISSDLNEEVNIFIGRNGSGKTTFINLLTAVLYLDAKVLSRLDFEYIEIILKHKNSTRKITVSRLEKSYPFKILVYKIGNKKYEVPLSTREYEYRHLNFTSNYIQSYRELKNVLGKLLNLSWLSVHRDIYNPTLEDYYEEETSFSTSPIDRRLIDLTQKLKTYQLELADKGNEISKQFEKDVLMSMLFDKKFENVNLDLISKVSLQKEKEGLINAYKELGIYDTETNKRIINHITELENSINIIKQRQNEDSPKYFFDDIVPLPLFNRTQYIVNLSIDAENKKKEVFKYIKNYVDKLNLFFPDKKFNISTSGEISLVKGKINIPFEKMSSGEKQLFILLTETLLQRNQPFVFIADEPELSLHIDWQAKIVSSIRELNEQAQIIVATHSPEIGGAWANRLINMEEIIDG